MIEYPTRDWVAIALRWRGTVLPRVAGRTAICMGIAAVGEYLRLAGIVDLSVPVLVHTILAIALGLMLVFRTNASYDRYWEGRKLVAGMVHACRDLARQSESLLRDRDAKGRASRYVVALFATIRRDLRHERSLPELEGVLSPGELAEIAGRRAPPLAVSRWLTDVFVAEADAGRLSEQRLTSLNASVSQLIGLWGAAERIVRTPVPFAYAHHIKLFLALFCFTVPLALIPALSWYAILGSGVVGFGMFGIDEIGVEIEDPFGYDPNDLPLDAIGEALATDVTETVGDGRSAPSRDNQSPPP